MKENKKEDYMGLYTRVGSEIGWDFSKIDSEKEVDSEFDYWEVVKGFLNENSKVLDVGCGSAQKTLKQLSAKKIYGIDIEVEMIKKAKKNLKLFPEKDNMFEFLTMNGQEKLDFENGFFDIVISRHCGVDASEMKRVLKSGGVFVSEDIDKFDCYELKKEFNRGQQFFDKESLKASVLKELVKVGFSSVKSFDIKEMEYYKSIDDLIYLLKRTPIITNFGESVKDYEILNRYISNNTTSKGILLQRRLFGVIVIK